MMKKNILPSVLVVGLLLTSCSNSSDDDVIPIDIPTTTVVTYASTLKSIIDSNCLTCHSNPIQNSAPMHLTTYDAVKEAVQNRGLITRIENGTMPPTGTLTSAQVQAVKDWQAGGFLQ